MTRDQKAQLVVMFFTDTVWFILAMPGWIVLLYIKLGAPKVASAARKVRLLV